ncbi:MAG: right-handed parallel beta-helix repeat-containing protein [Planctomycetota bacterium]|nr:right-handed parallel beta-helix repeat-containing protein [Planctomycetota bacterium]
MNNPATIIAPCLPLLVLLCSGAVPAEVLHVAPTGKTGAAGTATDPLGSLGAARDALRRLEGRRAGPVTVTIRGGHYIVDKPFALFKADSGTAAAPITFRAAEGERATFFGGKILSKSSFCPAADRAFLARLVDRSAGKHILIADLKAQGITDFGEITRHGWSMEPWNRTPPVTLAFANQRMQLARWPNGGEESEFMVYRHYLPTKRKLRGYELEVQRIIDNIRLPGEATYTRVIDPGPRLSRYRADRGVAARLGGGTFEVAFDRMKHWYDLRNVFLDGVLSSTWEWTFNRLASVDVARKRITLARPELSGIGLGESVRLPHFHFVNIPEEIDRPGEYYIDRARGLLYLYPPKSFDAGPAVLSVLAGPMVKMQGVANVTFEGLRFETGRGLGFAIEGCRDVTIRNCTIANFTAGGLTITGRGVRVLDSHIHGLGGHGVHLRGGDFESLEPAGNEVVNCHIHDFGWDQKSQLPGVMIDGVGHRVAHCDIHDGPHFGIRIRRSNDVTIEYNEIHHLPKYHMFDGGSLYVYTGPRAESRGITVRYNYFHDVPTVGVYPDNFSWGVAIHGNVFRNVGAVTGRPAVLVNGGGECRTYNNLMIDCVLMYGQGARAKEQRWFSHWNKTRDKFGDGKIEQTPYRKYPGFKVWLSKKEPDEFFRPVSHVYSNVLFHPNVPLATESGPKGIFDHSGKLDAHDNWVTTGDPGLADPGAGDLSLKQNAPAFNKVPGFKPIPFDQMGLRTNDPEGTGDER